MNNPYAPPRAQPVPLPPQMPMAIAAQPAKANGPMTAMGAILLCFGALGLLSLPLVKLVGKMARDPVSRAIDEFTWSGTYGAWTRVALVLGMVLAITQIVSGIGIMRLRPWARTAGIGYGIGAIVIAAVGQVMMATFLWPEMSRLAELHAHDPIARAATTGGTVGGIIGGLFSFILPVVTLVVLTRRSVREQFEAQR